MSIAWLLVGCFLVLGVLWEAFETVVLPRRVTRQFRLTRVFYQYTWIPWRALARSFRLRKRREAFFSVYGPLSLVMLLILWATTLVIGFAVLHYSVNSPMAPQPSPDFWSDLYFSGTSFFTL